MYYVYLTYPDPKLAKKMAKHINKGYPDVAIVKDNCCAVRRDYLTYCEQYVLRECKIKPEQGE